MSPACVAGATNMGLIGSVSRFVDCRADIFGVRAYGVLAVPGSTLTMVVTGLLTIAVAIIGYNLLIGRMVELRSSTVVMMKIGAVLALTTSWPAYQVLIYDVVTRGPGELVAEIGPKAGLPGSDGTLTERLDLADLAMQRLAILGAGQLPELEAEKSPPPPVVGFNAFALGTSRIIFLLSALAGLVGVRLVTALMLALGPLFVTCLLFEGTRGFFEGWVRVVGGAAITMIGVFVALGFELAILEPWLAAVLARRLGGEPVPSAPTDLFVITCLFAIVLVVMATASARLTAAFKLGRWGSPRYAVVRDAARPGAPAEPMALREAAPRGDQRSRAVALAGTIATMQRRASGGRQPASSDRSALDGERKDTAPTASREAGLPVPLGRTFPRRSRPRASASARRRDKNV